MHREDIIAVCKLAGQVGTVNHVDFADYVIALEASRRVGGEYQTSELAYMQVDGKLAMANTDHRNQQKRLDFAPPQILVNDDTTLTILVTITSEVYGTRHGIATSRKKNGTQAEKAWPYEVAETSAIGRALTAMGYGLLPGAGLASAEDMQRATASVDEAPGATPPGNGNGNGHANGNGNGHGAAAPNGSGPISPATRAPADSAPRQPQPISRNQRAKLYQMYTERFGGDEATATNGLDAIFQSAFKHSMAAATIPEASQIITQMTAQGSARATSASAAAPTAPVSRPPESAAAIRQPIAAHPPA